MRVAYDALGWVLLGGLLGVGLTLFVLTVTLLLFGRGTLI